MQQEKDYILREIQRLTLLLTKLIGKALGLNPNEFEQETQNIESDLKTEFDLTLREISKMEDSVLLERIHKLNEEHLEKLAELISVLLNNKRIFNISIRNTHEWCIHELKHYDQPIHYSL